MLTHNEYLITGQNGGKSFTISLPCYAGDGDDFFSAMRINRFYSCFADHLYREAMILINEDVRRSVFLAKYDCNESDGVITITVSLLLRRQKLGEKTKTHTKTFTHSWKNGVIIKRKISTTSIV